MVPNGSIYRRSVFTSLIAAAAFSFFVFYRALPGLFPVPACTAAHFSENTRDGKADSNLVQHLRQST